MTGLSFLPLSGNGSLTVNVSTYCTVCTVLKVYTSNYCGFWLCRGKDAPKCSTLQVFTHLD
jgi:hypothetical protein